MGVLLSITAIDYTWVVVLIRVPFEIPKIVRHPAQSGPKRDSTLANYPHVYTIRHDLIVLQMSVRALWGSFGFPEA